MTEESSLEDAYEEQYEDFIDLGGGFDNNSDETLVANPNYLEQHAVMPELTGDLEAPV